MPWTTQPSSLGCVLDRCWTVEEDRGEDGRTGGKLRTLGDRMKMHKNSAGSEGG
jgi:hypothetical protein